MKYIVYKDGDNLQIVIPAPAAQEDGESEVEFLNRVAEQTVPKGVDFQLIDPEHLPSDRTFRNAWRKDGDYITYDMAKSCEIAHSMRREKRESEFAPFDTIVALRLPGEDVAEQERVKIREKYASIQIQIDEALTIEQLKAVL